MYKSMYKNISIFFAVVLFLYAATASADSDWKATLKVSGGGFSNYCIFGAHDGATDGGDTWDVPAPPGSLSDTYLYIYFPHSEWGGTFDRFRQDIKAPGLPKEWTFDVASNISAELTIEWPDLKNAIPDKEAVLIDVDGGGGEIDMHLNSSFVFGNTGVSRRFLVRISESIPVPQSPEGLFGKLTKDNKVLLYWKGNQELDLAGYNVYRSTTPGSGYQRINYSLVEKHIYEDEQITEDTYYYYVVTAVNTEGGESGYSNEVEVYVPPAVPPPDPPQLLRGRSVGTAVILLWRGNRERDIAGYNIYRSTTSGSGYQKINSSLSRWSLFVDRDVESGETYYYVVTAVNTEGGESGYSNEFGVTVFNRWINYRW